MVGQGAQSITALLCGTKVAVIDFDMNPQQAVDAPRWTHTPGTDPATINQDPFLDLDLGMPADIKEALSDLGHNVEVNDSGSFGGSAKMIKINRESGVISGGSDRRSDGLASALQVRIEYIF